MRYATRFANEISDHGETMYLRKPQTILRALLAILALSLTACSANATPVDTPTATITETVTATATMPPTATSSPTPTSTSTPTLMPTATPTTEPTHTFTPRPTKVPVTPTATSAPSTASFPPPEVHPFDVGGLIDYLGRAHDSFQQFLSGFGNIVAHGIKGNCNWYIQVRNDWMGMIAFSDVPDQWQPWYSEYRSLIAGAFDVTLPIHNVCNAGGGTIDDATDQKIINFFDSAQNRLYALIQQANSMR